MLDPGCWILDKSKGNLFSSRWFDLKRDKLQEMNYPAAEQRGIRCHAGLDPASSLDFWIPAFAGMTIRCKRMGY